MAEIRASAWLTNRQLRVESKFRIFCFPHAGDLGTAFFSWDRLFEAGIEICPIILPGRSMRSNEPLLRRVEPVVSEVCESIEPFLDRPFAFFGHSLGALLAYELTCRLQRDGRSPATVFLAGRRAPHLPKSGADLHSLNCAVVALCGQADVFANPEDMGAWRSLVSSTFTLYTFPAGHFFVRSAEHEVAALLQSHLKSLLPAR